jgi:hypothetical protein
MCQGSSMFHSVHVTSSSSPPTVGSPLESLAQCPSAHLEQAPQLEWDSFEETFYKLPINLQFFKAQTPPPVQSQGPLLRSNSTNFRCSTLRSLQSYRSQLTSLKTQRSPAVSDTFPLARHEGNCESYFWDQKDEAQKHQRKPEGGGFWKIRRDSLMAENASTTNPFMHSRGAEVS